MTYPKFITIPAGNFIYGYEQEEIYLPEYQISETPVTNAQWAGFRDVKIDPKKLDHPVVNISAFEAEAYCAWLSEEINKEVKLPSEVEWEKAARGTDRRIYPWGNVFDHSRCNTCESGIMDTTSVFAYPYGKSPYGILDMAGNVWEWTRTQINAVRMLRGGSFGSPRDYVRCALRFRLNPVDFYHSLGFRVVVSP